MLVTLLFLVVAVAALVYLPRVISPKPTSVYTRPPVHDLVEDAPPVAPTVAPVETVETETK